MYSQETITRTLGEFEEIKVYDLINVELIKSTENKIIISGKHAQDVSIKQKNKALKIKMKLKKMFSGSETNVKVYYSNLDVIDANQGSVITSADLIKQYELKIKAQEGAYISAKAETEILEIKSVTGGTVEISGSSSKQKVRITTGGIYKGSKLLAENTDIDIKTGGKAEVKTNNVLEIKIFSGGDVFIYGTPKQLKQRKVFGGRIMFKD
tara:strand:- start:99 stop:728 length:630 start_codon:yes stop_codon:yes gene_type:complete